jgi:hypothetical protein
VAQVVGESLHIYPTPLYLVVASYAYQTRNGAEPRSYWIRIHITVYGFPRRPQRVEKPAGSGADLKRWPPRRSLPFAEGVGAGGRRASTCASLLGPLPENVSSRFMFCPAAITIASAFIRQSLLSLKRLIPCHSLASPKSGSTHTLRLRNAFSYGPVSR